MGSHHKRNEGLKPVRRTAKQPKPERKTRPVSLDHHALATRSLQQQLLNILADHFRDTLQDPLYEKRLQAIKAHFFRRDYAAVFSNPEACVDYAVRYLPSRALAYAELFLTQPILALLYPPPLPRRPSAKRPDSSSDKPKRLVAVGAGVGSELCALHLLPQLKRLQLEDDEEDAIEALQQELGIDIVDHAEYDTFLESLLNRLQATTPPTLRHTYHQQDILAWSGSTEWTNLLAETTLLTFMFVFNELFTTSKSLTMQLIASIAKHLPSSSYVLLVESAGDVSEVKLSHHKDTEEDKGMMVYKFWDHLPGFEAVLSTDRQWFRIDAALHYPLEMENVSYFTRLYRKL